MERKWVQRSQDPIQDPVVSSVCFLLASYNLRLGVEGANNLETPRCTKKKHTHTHKMPTFPSQRTRKGTANKDRKLADNNHSTLAKQPRKIHAFPHSGSKDQVRSLDFYPYETVKKSISITLPQWCQRRPSREARQDHLPYWLVMRSCPRYQYRRHGKPGLSLSPAVVKLLSAGELSEKA